MEGRDYTVKFRTNIEFAQLILKENMETKISINKVFFS